MLKLIHVTKEYKTKKNKAVEALKDVTFELPNKGFYCFIGKSGSGKSTLLNLIGGLDEPSNGEIIINGDDSTEFSNEEWDYYRGRNVGFIFQEFNLIEELSVYDNIALSLEVLGFKENEIKEKIDEVLNHLELNDYGYRKIYELSGGEKQRIAIARAIIKNPSIILADEPTGNLDQETGAIILNLLKDLSKNHLVILVTHDVENAEKFADGIFKMSHGQLVEEKIINIYENEDIKKKESIEKCKLPNKYVFQLAFKNFLSRRIRLILTFVLFIMSLMMVFFSISILRFNYGEVSFDTLNKYHTNEVNIEYFIDCNDCSTKNQKMYTDILKLAEKYNDLEIDSLVKIDGKFDSEVRPDPSRLDLSNIDGMIIYIQMDPNRILYGNISNKEDEILISDYIAYMLIHYKVYNIQDINQLIGKDLVFKNVGKVIKYKISGIVKTDYDDSKNNRDTLTDEQVDNFLLFNHHTSIYLNQDNLEYLKKNLKIINIGFGYRHNGLNYTFTDMVKASEFSNETNYFGKLPTQKDEIMLSLSRVLELEGVKYKEFEKNKEEYINNWVGQPIQFEVDSLSYQPLKSGYKIVGIIDDVTDTSFPKINAPIYVTDEYYKEYYDLNFYYQEINGKVFFTSHDKSMIDFLNDIKDLNYRHSSYTSQYINFMYDDIIQYGKIVFSITIFMVILTGLLIYSTIGHFIEDRKTQIGILRSLGLTGKDCRKVFFSEMLYLLLGVLVITFALLPFIMSIMNQEVKHIYKIGIRLFYFKVDNILYTILLSYIIAVIATYKPLRKMVKMKLVSLINRP